MSISFGETQAQTSKTYRLEARTELRLKVSGDPLTVRLLEGSAEVFGAELADEKPYKLSHGSCAIYTWEGCMIEVTGTSKPEPYVAKAPCMVEYANVHQILNERRNAVARYLRSAEAKDNTEVCGPRVMVVGEANTGKSSIVRILINYAVRMAWKPTFVDLDPERNRLSIPGTITATPVEYVIGGGDEDEIMNHSVKLPLIYFYGHTSITDNKELYANLQERLAESVEKRIKRPGADVEVRAGGVVIDTPACLGDDDASIASILHTIDVFKVDFVVVVDNESLQRRLETDITNPNVAVASVGKSGGVMSLNPAARKTERARLIREYFYGAQGELAPREQSISLNKISIFSTSQQESLPDTALPLGQQSLLLRTGFAPVVPSQDIVGSIVAVSFATMNAELDKAPVAGFLYIKSVDSNTRTMLALAPNYDPIPGQHRALIGSIGWFDQ